MGTAMAEPAQKEPTMEEILSSIRKIIADDDAPAQAAAEADVITEDELDVFDDFDIEAEAEARRAMACHCDCHSCSRAWGGDGGDGGETEPDVGDVVLLPAAPSSLTLRTPRCARRRSLGVRPMDDDSDR